MSVVNRMLQDIDRRLAASGVDALTAYPEIRSVPGARAQPRAASHAAGWRMVVLLVVLAGLAAWFFLGAGASGPDGATTPGDRAAPRTMKVAVRAPGAVSVASDTAHAAPHEPHATGDGAESATQGSDESLPSLSLKLSALLAEIPPEPVPAAREPVATLTPMPRPRAMASSAPSAGPSQPETAHSAPRTQAAEPPAAAQSSRVTIETVAPAAGAKNVPVRRVAPEETIEAARALWREGAHEAAVTTLREAMAGAQSPGNGAAASQLARELARFEIADNHVQAALDLLKGHEAALHADAEAWALRGNAEQRLALHSDAADSYQMALRLRPGQGKWMLGAAISLAAQGHRGEAQAWVDQAQARGAVTPAIATYLRQLGLDTH